MNYGSPTPSTVAYASQDARMAFVRKVYGLFFISILISCIAGWFSVQPNMIEFAWENHFILWLIGFGMIFAMNYAKRIQGLNLILLYAFSALMGVVFGPVFYIYERIAPGLPMEAASMATAVFGGLTLYVMFTRQDFNWLGGFLFVSLLGLIVAGFLMAFFHIAAITTIYCIVGILIFSGFVLYDTSRIMTRLNYDEAPIGALELYLDFLNLVLLIMRLMGGNRR